MSWMMRILLSPERAWHDVSTDSSAGLLKTKPLPSAVRAGHKTLLVQMIAF